MKRIRENLNEMLLAYYIFSYVLLKRIVPNYREFSTLILTVNVVLVLMISLVYNKFKIKFSIKEIIIYLIIILYNLIDYNLRFNEFTVQTYTYMIIFAIVPIFLYMRVNKLSAFFNAFSFFSVLIAILYMFDPFQEYKYSMDYMGFGYSIMMVAYMGVYIKTKEKKSIVLKILLIIILIESIMFANKGAILSIAVFTFLYELLNNRNTIKKTCIMIVCIIILLNSKIIIEKIYEIANDNDINSYSLITLYEMVNKTSSGLSGREQIWEKAEGKINEKILFGNGAGYYRSINNGIYSHSIIFDVLIEYGIIIFTVLSVLILKGMLKIKREKEEYRLLGIIFLIMWCPKLFLSSYFQSEIGFWLFIIWGLVDRRRLIGEKNE